MGENKFGGEEEKSGGFIKFENVGDSVTGLLIKHEKRSTPKGQADNWTVFTKNGSQTFFASKDLQDKLAGAVIKYGIGNVLVQATFVKAVKTSGGNDFKQFEVFSKAKTDEALVELGIDPNKQDSF